MGFRFTRVAKTAGACAVLTTLAAGCLLPDGEADTIAYAGSDTTQDVMGAIANYYDASGYNSDGDDHDNILSVEVNPNSVAGDNACATRIYHSPAGAGETLAPNGSSNGRNALRTSVQNGDGCIDIARSSGGPRAIGPTGDLATFEYYAFALDALGYASASTLAPSNLTLQQFRDIYTCTVTNWNQVGGGNGPIERYVPQTGSGTYQFFLSDLMGGTNPALFSGPSCPAVQFTQENSGELIAANGDQQRAIVAYSAGNWIAQARGSAPDQRAGQTMRSMNGQNLVSFSAGVPSLNTGGPVVESNVTLNDPTPAYPGIRYVFNVIDSTHVDYNDVQRYVGFENAVNAPNCGQSGQPECVNPGASKLCDGDEEVRGIIRNFGFAPLNNTVSSRNLIGSRCRLFTP